MFWEWGAGPETATRGGTHLLKLFDDFFIFIQIWLVGSVNAWAANMRDGAETLPVKVWRVLREENLPGLESSVFRFFSFLTFICFAISPERRGRAEGEKQETQFMSSVSSLHC